MKSYLPSISSVKLPCAVVYQGDIHKVSTKKELVHGIAMANLEMPNLNRGKGNRAIRRAFKGKLYRTGSWNIIGGFFNQATRLRLIDLRRTRP